MKALKINVASPETVISDILSRTDAGISVYSFPSYEDLHRTLTPKRIAIIDVMAGKDRYRCGRLRALWGVISRRCMAI